MTQIAVVYSSVLGHTRAVAQHVAHGAGEIPGVTVDLIEIAADQIGANARWDNPAILARLAESDAIILGTPTYMGSAHGLFKLFLDAAFAPWLQQGWKDKIAAGFTNSASRSGDKLSTLSQLVVFAAQMGMIWVGVGDPPGGNRADSTPDDINQLGSWLGLMTQSPAEADHEHAPSAGDRHTAERFGRRVAVAAQRWMLGANDYPSTPISEDEARRRDRIGLDEWRKHHD